MTRTAVVQTRIDPDLRDRAAEVLERMGLTVSDAVRILLTRTANEGAPPIELLAGGAGHDAWFRRKVLEALETEASDVADDEVRARFAGRRAAARKAAGES